jgi:hypothetical protein
MQFALSDGWMYGLRATLLLAAFAGFAWALISARRQADRVNAQLAARLDTALAEISRLSGQVIALGGAIESLGTRLTQPAPAQQKSPAAASTHTRGYETAIRMARSGASVEEIVASCGTTRAEAKLLRRLHECGEPRRADAETIRIA